MRLMCFSIDHESGSVEEREKLALVGDRLEQVLGSLHEEIDGEAVAVSTCNRVEFYLAANESVQSAEAKLLGVVEKDLKASDTWKEMHKVYDGAECVRHLFELVSGLRSMVVGETEILGQVKGAYQKALERGVTGKFLNKLFQHSFNAAKETRTNTAITRGSVSVGSVSVDLAARIFGDLRKMRVLVLGAGETSERVARTLAAKGVHSVLVANRTFDRAKALADELEGEALHWEDWENWLSSADIVISSTAAPHFVLHKEQIEKTIPHRGFRPLFLVDLAVPRDIEPEVASVDSVYLYDIDDLHGIAATNLKERELEAEKCRVLLRRHEERFNTWLQRAGNRSGGEDRSISGEFGKA